MKPLTKDLIWIALGALALVMVASIGMAVYEWAVTP